MSSPAVMREKVRALIERHCEWLAERAREIDGRTQRLMSGPEPTRAEMAEFRELAHQIAGASGTMGFAEVSAAARALEDVLERLANPGAGPAGVAAASLVTGPAAQLGQAIAQAVPRRSALYNREFGPVAGARNHAW
jgi:HPt (histidine-containing phosphotransfer) domain-containing protein